MVLLVGAVLYCGRAVGCGRKAGNTATIIMTMMICGSRTKREEGRKLEQREDARSGIKFQK